MPKSCWKHSNVENRQIRYVNLAPNLRNHRKSPKNRSLNRDLLIFLNRYGIFWVPPGESSCPDSSEYVWQRVVESLPGQFKAAQSWRLWGSGRSFGSSRSGGSCGSFGSCGCSTSNIDGLVGLVSLIGWVGLEGLVCLMGIFFYLIWPKSIFKWNYCLLWSKRIWWSLSPW